MQLVLLLLVGIQASISFTHNGGSVTKGIYNMRKLSSRGNKCLPCMIVDFAEKTIQLGDKLEISPMGVGAWAWGDKAYWTYDSSQEAAAKEAFSKSLLYGLNLFDTAEVYGLGTEWGHSEILCGRFAREMQVKAVSVPSQEVIIATKFAPIPLRTSRESVLKALRESLERIGADKCDLYQLHWPSFFFDAQYWDGLADAFDAGLVRAVGVSNYSAKRLAAAHRALAARGIPLASNQVYLRLRADPFGGCIFPAFCGLTVGGAGSVQPCASHARSERGAEGLRGPRRPAARLLPARTGPPDRRLQVWPKAVASPVRRRPSPSRARRASELCPARKECRTTCKTATNSIAAFQADCSTAARIGCRGG